MQASSFTPGAAQSERVRTSYATCTCVRLLRPLCIKYRTCNTARFDACSLKRLVVTAAQLTRAHHVTVYVMPGCTTVLTTWSSSGQWVR